MKSFEELLAWQRAIELAAIRYVLTRAFPKDELFGLTAQVRRAAISISSNIAQGQPRAGPREFIQFLCIARGSNAEVRSQFVLARRLGLGDPEIIADAQALTMDKQNDKCTYLRLAP